MFVHSTTTTPYLYMHTVTELQFLCSPCIATCDCRTFKYWMSLTEVSSGSPAVSMRANSVMKRLPFFLKIR